MNNEIYSQLIEELDHNRELEKKIRRFIASAPEGIVRSVSAKGRAEFRFYSEKLKDKYPNGKYIPKEKMSFAGKIIQRDYYQQLLGAIEKIDKNLEKTVKCYQQNNPEIIYNKQCESRKKYIVPEFVVNELYIARWKESKAGKRNSYEMTSDICTENGEHVRSKSEKIIADKLKAMCIPYIYEPEVVFEDKTRLFADFAVLNIRTGKEYYFEHFGMMDNSEYSLNAIRKIEKYQNHGLFLGESIICSFETKEHMPDNAMLEKMFRKYFK